MKRRKVTFGSYGDSIGMRNNLTGDAHLTVNLELVEGPQALAGREYRLRLSPAQATRLAHSLITQLAFLGDSNGVANDSGAGIRATT